MALVGKSRRERGIRKAVAGFHQPAHLIELPHGAKWQDRVHAEKS